MKITFLGGADEVGASSTLIEIGGKRLLLDAGIRPSPKARWGLAGDQLPGLSLIDSLGGVDAVLVTHAHTDHTGALELVTGRFPDVPVYATLPTITLTRILHQDSRRIMQTRLEEEGELPLFDDVAVQRLLSAFHPVPFRSPLPLGENLSATFFPAGHIAGAAMIGLESDEGNLLLTGDFSISPQRTVDGARPPAFRPDLLITESTYGGRLHANREVQERKLVEAVWRVTSEGGKVLIPAFALGRAQEILLILSEFKRRGELPAVPVWADGMVRAICQAYAGFMDVLPLALQEQNAQFFSDQSRPVQNNEQRNKLIWEQSPAIIVSSSGMLAGGPSLSYARSLAGSPQHAILLTGYQDEESPGRRLQELAERGHGALRLGQDKVDVQCQLGSYMLSAHADESQVLSLVETLDPEQVLLVHGDEQARSSLEQALVERRRIVQQPRAGQTIELHFEKRKLRRVPGTKGTGEEPALPGSRWKELLPIGRGYYSPQELPGRWMILKQVDGNIVSARCLAVQADQIMVEAKGGQPQPAERQFVLAVLSDTPPEEATLAAYRSAAIGQAGMEPNQALKFITQLFPPEARLRKSGYRLDQHILTLTFDFPDATREKYADLISQLEQESGWQVELASEANQISLTTLARQVLPDDWRIAKGPAIHRDVKQVAVTVNISPGTAPGKARLEAKQRFYDESRYELIVVFSEAAPSALPPEPQVDTFGAPIEINAAYAMIRSELEGSSLYRTSLKGNEIMLSFISRQIGERYLPQIAALSQKTGWALSINPQPNQGAIIEAARSLLSQTGIPVSKGPGIYPDKAQVNVTTPASLEELTLERISVEFETQTGYKLVISASQPAPQSQQPKAGPANIVEIPLNRIRLRPFHQKLVLDPGKLSKAIERARRMGIDPPVEVRRASDVYFLVDGLYRLRAAEVIGLERIPAIVE